MDETKGTAQDTSPAQTGQSSGSEGGTTSKGKTYSDAEIAKIKSDSAAEAGRQRKVAEQERDTFKEKLQSSTSRLDALEKDVEESRLAEIKGDPEQEKIYHRERASRERARKADERERDLASREGQIKSEREVLESDRKVVSIAYIAAKHGLETEELESLGISDHDTLEKIAAKLARPKGADFTPDSGDTTGGGANWEQVRAAYIKNPSNPAVYKAYMDMRQQRDAQK